MNQKVSESQNDINSVLIHVYVKLLDWFQSIVNPAFLYLNGVSRVFISRTYEHVDRQSMTEHSVQHQFHVLCHISRLKIVWMNILFFMSWNYKHLFFMSGEILTFIMSFDGIKILFMKKRISIYLKWLSIFI